MNKMLFRTIPAAAIILAVLSFTFIQSPDKMNSTTDDGGLEGFLRNFEKNHIPLYEAYTTAYWTAAISGKDNDYRLAAEAELNYSTQFSNREEFEFLGKMNEAGGQDNELLNRQLTVVYNMYLPKQIEEGMLADMISSSNQIEQRFNTFRAVVNDKELTDNQIENILQTSLDSKQLEEAWRASRKVGGLVASELQHLVNLRNESARLLGFNNYHEMSLKVSGQDPEVVEKIFNNLDNITRDTYAQLKDSIDQYLSARLGIAPGDLMPWHYQNRFFQQAPAMYSLDLDKYYKGKDLALITSNFFKGIGMDVSDMMKKSDLLEKPGKNQHAFCIDLNKRGDIRVLCNMKPNEYWMNTMLHEFGHAVYNKYIDPSLPFVLRDPAHSFTTEAVAMFFGRLASNPLWLKEMGLITEAERLKIASVSEQKLRLEQLVFSRWAQVMYRFEKAMYETPDVNLNDLWWELVQEYQLLRRPEVVNEADWAAKIHIATSPCYYHNYLMGEMLASQMHYYVLGQILRVEDNVPLSIVNKKEIGAWFIERVFRPGNLYPWQNFVEQATGQNLLPAFYAKQFVGK